MTETIHLGTGRQHMAFELGSNTVESRGIFFWGGGISPLFCKKGTTHKISILLENEKVYPLDI